jgi:hypothetical protein
LYQPPEKRPTTKDDDDDDGMDRGARQLPA